MKYGILDHLTECGIEQSVLGPAAEIECFNCHHESELPDRISSLAAVMLWHVITLTSYVIYRLKECRVIVRVGVGFDNVDRVAAGEAGIPVVIIPDYGTNEVADHTMALLLSLCRQLARYRQTLQLDPVSGWQPEIAGEIRRLTGTTLGIVGMGKIGTAVALRAKSFGMKVIFYDPFIADGFERSLQVDRMSSLEDLVSTSDYLSLHAPLTDRTRRMIDVRILSLAKPGLTLINVARGGIVCLDAVFEALKCGRMRAFGADVLEAEPPDPRHPLIDAFQNDQSLSGRILLTPHSAFLTNESKWEMRLKSAQQMLNATQGIPLRNCVNFQYLRNPRTEVVPTAAPAWDT